MAEALITGVLEAGVVKAADIVAADVDAARLQELGGRLGIRAAADNAEAVAGADLVVLAVKPAQAMAALNQAAAGLQPGQTVVSIVAGVKSDDLKLLLPDGVGLVRVMPNTPCQVRMGMSVLATDTPASPEGRARARALFACCGEVEELPEALFDAVTATSGSGPAYVFVLIEALADGGVRAGLPRAAALRLAAQTVLGSARMVIAGGRHPGELKDMVTSPAGTTIAGLAALEQRGFRGAVMEAVYAAARRSAELGKQGG